MTGDPSEDRPGFVTPDAETLRQVLEHVPDFVIVIDHDGLVRYMNRVAEGFDLADVIGAEAVGFIDPPFRALHLEVFGRVLGTGQADEYELTVSADPDDIRWYRARLTPIPAGGPVRFVVSVATETTAVHREREAREAAKHLASALGAYVPICAWCRRIRREGGGWQGLEAFVEERTGAAVSHGICPECEARMEEEGVPG